MRGTPGEAQVIKEAVPLGCTGHVLHKATHSSLGGIAALPNIHIQHREAAKMRRQRNMSQMKEQNRTPEKELNNIDTSNLLDAEFKTLVKRMLNELRERIDELSENCNKEI